MTGFKQYIIIEYFYIYWFITFLQKEFRVMWYIFDIINPSGTINEDWHISKIVEPVILTGIVFLVLVSSDWSGIFLISDIIILNDTQ